MLVVLVLSAVAGLLGAALQLSTNLLSRLFPDDWVRHHSLTIAAATGLLAAACTAATVIITSLVQARRGISATEAPSASVRDSKVGLMAAISTVHGDVNMGGVPSARLSGAKQEEERHVSLPPRNPTFTGRGDLLKRLHRLLIAGHFVTLSGLGGVGKTQAVIEYAYRHGDQYSLLWLIPAASPTQILTAMSMLAKALGCSTEAASADIVAAVREELGRRRGWLLIFDNADTPEDLIPFLPTSGDVQRGAAALPEDALRLASRRRTRHSA